MKSTFLFAMFLFVAFSSCKKDRAVEPNYDVVNKFLRVVVSSDANYSVIITETPANNAEPIVLNTESDAGYEFNYGFPPKIGNTVHVKIVSPAGERLNSTIFYKNQKIGPTIVRNSENQLAVDFTYVVKD